MNKGYIVFLGLALLLQGCASTGHAVGKQAIGRASDSAEMERLIDRPGVVRLETITSADWQVARSGVLNLNSPAAVQAGLKDGDEPVHVYAHLIRHPVHGNFLVDTGVSQKLVDDPSAAGLNWLLQQAMHIDRLAIRKSTGEIVAGLDGKLSGVMFTHLHLDHIAGMPDIPDGVPLYVGASETGGTSFKNLFVRGATDSLLKDHPPLQPWNFQPDPQRRFAGVIDVFEDGSVFAISVPGHTHGSVAFLVRTVDGPVLLTGDTCHTRWGWEHAVEPGDFSDDGSGNLASLKALKELVARHPGMAVRLGHQD